MSLRAILLGALSLCASLAWTNNLQKVQDFIKAQYLSRYDGLHISSVNLLLNKNTKINEVVLDQITLKPVVNSKFSGILSLDYTYKGYRYHDDIKYSLEGKIDALIAKMNIKGGENLTEQNTRKASLSLSDIRHIPASKTDVLSGAAKFFITKDSVISENYITKRILIRKNEMFTAHYKNEGVYVEITLRAKENGQKDQVIEAINPVTKKVLNVKVIDLNKGEIL